MYNKSRLFRAAETNDLSHLEIYIKCKDDINIVSDHYNPLWIAASEGHASIVKCLLKNNAKIDSPLPAWRDNLLFFAINKGHLNVVLTLIEEGFDLNEKNRRGLTPLEYARKLKQHDIAAALENFHSESPAKPFR